jgi:hypothetical protein
MISKHVAPWLFALLAAAPASAWAQAPAPPAEPPPAAPPAGATPEAAAAPAEPAKPPAPAPYSLPWMMRGVTAGNSVRLDTVFAFAKPKTTVPVLLTGSYKVIPNLAIIARLGIIHNTPTPETSIEKTGTSFVNPLIGATYALSIGKGGKASFFAATTIPVGTGGGNDPNQATRRADLAGIPARAAMDNALFQINYMTPIVGADIAYVNSGFTVQAEVTLLELIRVRGEKQDKDATRTNLTAGAHFGYFPIPQLSFGVELRYQYWIKNDTIWNGKDPTATDNWTLGFGPRAHFKIGEKMWFRPGVSLTMSLDRPTGFSGTGSEYKLVQVDLPFAF